MPSTTRPRHPIMAKIAKNFPTNRTWDTLPADLRALSGNHDCGNHDSSPRAWSRTKQALRIVPWLTALGIALVIMPSLSPYWIFILSGAAAWVGIGAGVNVTTGVAGLPALHQAAVMAVSSYAMAIALRNNVPFFPAWAMSIGIALVGTSLLVAPLMRLNGFYLAIASFTLVLLVEDVINNWQSVTQGPYGISVTMPRVLEGNSAEELYVVSACTALSSLAIYLLLRRSRTGLRIRAARDSVAASRAVGVEVTRTRIIALLWGNGIVAASGALLALSTRFVQPSMFGLQEVLSTILVVAIGGPDQLLSPVLGAVVVSIVPDTITSLGRSTNLVIDGTLLLVLTVAPNGVAGVRKLRRMG